MKSIQKRAFTLIELLVVIAIIAILAAILFPVFAQAKDAAKKTQTISNMKNLSTATIMYAGDVDDRMSFGWAFDWAGASDPASCSFQADFSKFRNWTEFVFPYVKNGANQGRYNDANANNNTASIFVDPVWNSTAPPKDGRGTALTVRDGSLALPYNSYIPNNLLMTPSLFLGCSWMGPASGGPASFTEIGKPAQTVMISQGYGKDGEDSYGNNVGLFDADGGLDAGYIKKLPQRDGMSFGYTDGHAKFVKTGNAWYSIDPAFAGNTNSVSGSYLPEPVGPVAASWRARPQATTAFGPRDGG